MGYVGASHVVLLVRQALTIESSLVDEPQAGR